jgi:uncharacterized protein DUF2795
VSFLVAGIRLQLRQTDRAKSTPVGSGAASVSLPRATKWKGPNVVGEGASASDVFEFLDGVEFPASREGLVALARANGAPQRVIAALQTRDAADFASAADLKDALGR